MELRHTRPVGRLALARWLATSLVVMTMALGVTTKDASAASASAGSSIGNSVTITYLLEDGTPVTIVSNAVSIRVAGAPGIDSLSDQVKRSTPASIVTFPHVLTNTGNVNDRYELSLSNGSGAAAYDTTAGGLPLTLSLDADCNGVADAGGVVISTAANAPAWTYLTPVLTPGSSMCFVASAAVGNTASVGSSLSMALGVRGHAATAAAGGANNTLGVAPYAPVAETFLHDQTTIDFGAQLELVQSFSKTTGDSPGGPITVTIQYMNRGATAASNVDLASLVGPASTSSPLSSLLGPGAPLLAVDSSGFEYVPGSATWSHSPGATLDDKDGPGDPAGIDYSVGVKAPGAIRAVISDLPAGASGFLTFQIRVLPGLLSATSDHTSLAAAASFQSGSGSSASPILLYAASNRTIYTVLGGALSSRSDLIIAKKAEGPFTVGYAGRYSLVVSNQGTEPTGDTIAVLDNLPQGVAFQGQASQHGWACVGDGQWSSSAGELVRCVTAMVIPERAPGGTPGTGQSIDLLVKPMVEHFGTLEAGPTTIRNIAAVRGGGGPNNDAPARESNAVETLVYPQGVVGGHAYVDSDHDGRYAVGTDKPLAGWQVSVCSWDPHEDDGLDPGTGLYPAINECDASVDPQAKASKARFPGYVIGSTGAPVQPVLTGSDGSFRLAGLKNGVYKVQFRSPTSLQTYSPGRGKAVHWSQRFVVIDVQKTADAMQTDLALEPTGIVYDTQSRAPLGGAMVHIQGPAGFDPALHLVGGVKGLHQVTLATGQGDDGRYDLTLIGAYPSGVYTITVDPPAGHTGLSKAFPAQRQALEIPGPGCTTTWSTCSVLADGSLVPPAEDAPHYYTSMNINSAQRSRLVANHLPIDPDGFDGEGKVLVIAKKADKSVVELGDFVNYTVTVTSANSQEVEGVSMKDILPSGFTYIKGSGLVAGKPLEPQLSSSGQMTWLLGDLAPRGQIVINYRAGVGANAQLGDGTNRAVAYNANVTSLEGKAKVKVVGGVFSDSAFILGKVFADCNSDGMQQPGEPGVPGVKLILDDGTFAITDIDGKYSLYGLDPRARTLKVDLVTLAEGTRLGVSSNRNAGDPGSLIVDLKKGELHRADFPILGCSDALKATIALARSEFKAPASELETARSNRLDATNSGIPSQNDAGLKSRPASGYISAGSSGQLGNDGGKDRGAFRSASGALATGGSGVGAALANQPSAPGGARANHAGTTPGAASTEDLPPTITSSLDRLGTLESMLSAEDPALAFLYPSEGEVMPTAQTWVRVKAPVGGQFKLEVNGVAVDASNRVGQRVVRADMNVMAWEYVAIPLRPGRNELTVKVVDDFGIERGRRQVSVVAPDVLGRIEIQPVAPYVADGKTPIRVKVKLTDNAGVPVTSRTPVTLSAVSGQWLADDADPTQSGVQIIINGGEADLQIKPPTSPGADLLQASSGAIRADKGLTYTADMRPLVAAGLVEGTFNLRRLSAGSVVAATERDSFDREIANLACRDSGNACAGVRGSLYLKGKVRGDALLTLAVDTDKDKQAVLFRDIRPDEFYPIYGDSSVKGYDAQSSDKLYVRVDKDHSFVMYGDLTTTSADTARKLSQYSRSMTGLRAGHEDETMKVGTFVSYDSLRQVVEELPGNGTSGPYQLSAASPSKLVNSEKVELLTRDRNQPSIIIDSKAMTRLLDYQLESDAGRLIFNAPIATFDPNGNPQSIRVTYEVDQGGQKFLVYGFDGQVRLSSALEIGGVSVHDLNPNGGYQLEGANGTIKITDDTYVLAEVARSRASGLAAGGDNPSNPETSGDAGRLELLTRGRIDDRAWDARVSIAQSSVGFVNPSSSLDKGRAESSAKSTLQLDSETKLEGEALFSEDSLTGTSRQGVVAGVTRELPAGMRLRLAGRHSQDELPTTGATSVAGEPVTTAGVRTDSVLANLSAPVPGLSDARAFVEIEQEVNRDHDSNVGIGGEMKIWDRTSLYAKHQLVSGIVSPFAIGQTTANQVTQVGIKSTEIQGTEVYSEYRINSALDGRSGEGAMGLRNTFPVTQDLKLSATAERVASIFGRDGTSNAATLGVDYRVTSDTRTTERFEIRDGTTQRAYLVQANAVSRLTPELSGIVRSTWDRAISTVSGSSAESAHLRLQGGVAWRDLEDNRLSGLGKLEYREETSTSTGLSAAVDSRAYIASSHLNLQADRATVISGRAAGKVVRDAGGGLLSRSYGTLLSTRLVRDLSPDWDVGVNASTLTTWPSGQRLGLGAEVGYILARNLRLGIGYNVFGYRDREFSDLNQTDRGFYMGLRLKFDEAMFGWMGDVTKKGAALGDEK